MKEKTFLAAVFIGLAAINCSSPRLTAADYTVVDTGQATCYGDSSEITCPQPGESYYGQDAQYDGNQLSYTLNGDGLTVYDNNAGLTWQRSPDTDGDGTIDSDDKLTFSEAQTYSSTLNAASYGGYSDWRVPTIKELYSLIDFRGTDPSMCDTEGDCPGLIPFIDTDYFDFAYGDTDAGERVIDSQWVTGSLYVANNNQMFGVNFADGRIKGYGLTSPVGGEKTFFVICVRGNTDYGVNDLVDNGDGTITDRATGLMWTQDDSGSGMFWEDALDYAENLEFAGHTDWRLANIKELQSILDYSRSPDTTSSAAIDPLFNVTSITNEEGQLDYPYYWAGTTHVGYPDNGAGVAYMAFGRGLGYMDGEWQDVHGAGCQRSDPKSGDPNDWPYGHGPQGDAVRIYNYVRCVRDASESTSDSSLRTDFDGDGTSDIALFREDSGLWAVRGVTRTYFGSSGDLPVPGDYNGDGTTEIAVFRDGSGLWAVRGVTRAYFGTDGDVPVPGDYDGDGSWEMGVFDDGSGLWAIRGVTRIYFGSSGDLAVPGYYDGDGAVDIGVFRPSSGLWSIRGISTVYFGGSGDTPVPGDYDGDGVWEASVFREGSGLWAVRNVTRAYFGGSSDEPVPADYDGDGTDDLGIFRDISGLWAVAGATRVYYGAVGDVPVTR